MKCERGAAYSRISAKLHGIVQNCTLEHVDGNLPQKNNSYNMLFLCKLKNKFGFSSILARGLLKQEVIAKKFFNPQQKPNGGKT